MILYSLSDMNVFKLTTIQHDLINLSLMSLCDNLNLLTNAKYFLHIDYCKRIRKKYVLLSVNSDV
jgi:hypothetical protein